MAVCLSLASPAYSARGVSDSSSAAAPTPETYVDPISGSTTTTQYTYKGPTIKQAAQSSASNNNLGMILGIAGTAAAGKCAASTCGNPGSGWTCAMCISGMVAGIAVTYQMVQARNKSYNTVAAVNTDAGLKDPNGNPLADKEAASAVLEKNDEWQQAMAAKKKLEKAGWKFDVKKGIAKGPKGEVISGSLASSADSMRTAGAPDSAIKDYTSTMQSALQKAAEKAKGADNDMFGGDLGGGGSGAPVVAAAADGSQGFSMPGQPRLGINRDPAQVAGMKKDYKGNPIGVAGDSLFDMIDRRYQLHRENGSFLAP